MMLYRKAHRALRVHGVLGTLRLVFERARGRDTTVESDFDTRYGTETSGREDLSELTLVDRTHFLLGNRYMGTHETIIADMIAVVPHALNECLFIDVGAGKGKALLVASESPFRKIIGVELAEELTATARKNIAIYTSPTQQCRDLEVVCQDATAFRFPPTPTVLFLANPFHGVVMQQVIANVEESLRQHPRPFYVIYRQAKEKALWDASPYFIKLASTSMFEAYRAVGRA